MVTVTVCGCCRAPASHAFRNMLIIDASAAATGSVRADLPDERPSLHISKRSGISKTRLLLQELTKEMYGNIHTRGTQAYTRV